MIWLHWQYFKKFIVSFGLFMTYETYPLRLCILKNVISSMFKNLLYNHRPTGCGLSRHLNTEDASYKVLQEKPTFSEFWKFCLWSSSSSYLQINLHGIVVHLITGAEDRLFSNESFCRRLHRNREWIQLCRLLMAEELTCDYNTMKIFFINKELNIKLESHLGLKLGLWTLLTFESTGLNGQGDLLPK